MTRKTVKFDFNPLFNGPSLEARNRLGNPFRYLQLSEIDVDPDQPRKTFEPEALSELASSIKEYGILSPILVRVTAGGSFRVVSGERRLRAAKLAGLETIPAIIDSEEGPNSRTLSKQLVENIQREDLSSLERAWAIGELKEKNSLSVREIARYLGISKSAVQRSLDVLGLPEELKTALIGGVSESKILVIAQMPDKESRRKLLERIDELTRSDLERIVSEAITARSKGAGASHGGTESKENGKRQLSVEERRLVEDMQRSLGTKIQLVRGKKPGQGKVVIDYYSEEELHGLYQKLSS